MVNYYKRRLIWSLDKSDYGNQTETLTIMRSV